MGNILQNAFEAAIKADVPRIRVELVEHKEEIFVVIRNSTAKRINTKTDFFMTSKEDKENHGFGMYSLASSVFFSFINSLTAPRLRCLCSIFYQHSRDTLFHFSYA